MFVALRGAGPAYMRLFCGLRDAITTGRIEAGTRLPSTRELASDLKLSRNTVMRAYEQLIAEGFASARQGGGTFIDAVHVQSTTPAVTKAKPGPLPLSQSALRMLPAVANNPFMELRGLTPVRHDFMYCIPDPSLFPIQEWRRRLSRAIDRASRRSLSYDDPAGLLQLRDLIAARLIKYRGVRCAPEQIVVVSGAQQALDLICRLVVEPGAPVVVEDPCYPAARAILAAGGAQLVPAHVDGEGFDIASVDASIDATCRLAYVTPSHQFPSGAVLSNRRRKLLVEWAARVGAFVIEDDYDSDYRYVGPPLQALQGMSPEHVIHVGTFSKSLFPSLRLGYVVAPHQLLEPLISAKWIADWGSPAHIQHALAAFIDEGWFARHVKRTTSVYARRRAMLLEAIEREFGRDVTASGGDAGMHLVLWLHRLKPEHVGPLLVSAREHGVGVYSVSSFYERPPERAGLVLGYGTIPEARIAEGIAILARLVRARIKAKAP
jgi:GntR family transcriptional regulator / MocR family aminotransferase